MASSGEPLLSIVAVLLLAASALWVFRDSSARVERGAPVVFTIGSSEVDTPAAWAVGCLVLWVVFMPLYLVCRKQGATRH